MGQLEHTALKPGIDYWIDGFNLFYAWERTKPILMGRGWDDPGAVIAKSLGLLSELMGEKRSKALIFLDGGVKRGYRMENRFHVWYAGPDKKADFDIRKAVELNPSQVSVVTNDHEIVNYARVCGVNVISTDGFIGMFETGGSENPFKEKKLSSAEVEEWLDYFGESEQDG